MAMKKLFISVDIEGVAGISLWDEADHLHARGAYFAEQMTKEAAAAAQAGLDMGYDVVVRDAHSSARNMDMSAFPQGVKFIRGWSGSPMKMMEGLDKSYSAAIYIGYHSAAYTNSNPLAHTISSSRFQKLMLNGSILSEFRINTYLAYYNGVPVVALSGDEGICAEAKAFSDRIETFATSVGIGDASLALHPIDSVNGIYQMVKKALSKDMSTYNISMPESFEFSVQFKEMRDAYKASFFPNAYSIDAKTVALNSDDFFEIARFLLFI